MDPHSILDKGHADETLPAEALGHSSSGGGNVAEPARAEVQFPAEDGGKSLAEMAERDLAATLQLLAERAQYITGATGAAIALRDSGEMVCRASAGPSAPEVGTQLQVNSGLSGESVRTRQTLRCDDAYTDERVNRESCEALGIRSVVVMPLLGDDEVIGVFELFSDKANIFEARDIAALERMGFMVHTALEHSSAALGLPTPVRAGHPPVEGHLNQAAGPSMQDTATEVTPLKIAPRNVIPIPLVTDTFAVAPIDRFEDPTAPVSPGIAFHMKMPAPPQTESATEMPAATAATAVPGSHSNESLLSGSDSTSDSTEETDILDIPAEPVVQPLVAASPSAEDILMEGREPVPPAPMASTVPAVAGPAVAEAPPTVAASGDSPAPVMKSRGAVASLRKCESCGFPVSEGRQYCLDCEKKNVRQAPVAVNSASDSTSAPTGVAPSASAATTNPTTITGTVPHFLVGEPEEVSWLASHKLMIVAIVLAVVGVAGILMLR